MIYAIEAVGTAFIKIGRAKSVGKRLKELEVACPHELYILAVADWPDGAETAIHAYLEPMAERGEWFRNGKLTLEVLAWMVNGIAIKIKGARRAISLARARGELSDDRVVRRRAEREAYWRVRPQQYDSGAPHNGVITTVAAVDSSQIQVSNQSVAD